MCPADQFNVLNLSNNIVHTCIDDINNIFLTLFDIGFFEIVSHGGGGAMMAPHHNFVVVAPNNHEIWHKCQA